MNRRSFLSTLAPAVGVTVAGCAEGPQDGADAGDDGPQDGNTGGNGESSGTVTFEVETVTEGLTNPWGIAFLPGDSLALVTERPGDLLLVDRESGETTSVGGVPKVYAAGQGGLLDVTLHPEFPADKWVYLTYAARNEAGDSATHLGRGRLDAETGELSDVEELHVAEPFVNSTGHYGSRVVFGTDGMAYITAGDRQFKDFGPDHVSQDTTNELGTTLRLAPDGTVPDDNPFVDEGGVVDSIFSYGHRNPQGMTVHPETGALWQAEHGERDGDEINVVEAGNNYGWPIASEACKYGTDDPVAESHDEREDVTAPVHFWECGSGGFPPSGATFYDGEAFPEWQGDLFVGNLAGKYLGRFTVDGRTVTEQEPLLNGQGWRVREASVAPDTGHLYVLVDDADAPLVRLVPE